MIKPLIIFGASHMAELAQYYFTNDAKREVAAFAVDGDYIKEDTFGRLPVVPFEEITEKFGSNTHDLFIALGYSKINKIRKDRFDTAKSMGYDLPSYISSKATVLNDRKIGENCFILEDNTIQPFVTIGDNVTLWSGNHIGHHSTIEDHVFIASHVVVSGNCKIEESCFIGVNATLRDGITIGSRCVLGAGTLILSDCEPQGVYIGKATERSRVPSTRLRNI